MQQKRPKMPFPTALGRIYRQQFQASLTKFCSCIRDDRFTNTPDMASLAASSRLQNAIECCIKVRKASPAGSPIIALQFDAIAPTDDRMPTGMFKLSGAAFCLSQPIGALLVR